MVSYPYRTIGFNYNWVQLLPSGQVLTLATAMKLLQCPPGHSIFIHSSPSSLPNNNQILPDVILLHLHNFQFFFCVDIISEFKGLKEESLK